MWKLAKNLQKQVRLKMVYSKGGNMKVVSFLLTLLLVVLIFLWASEVYKESKFKVSMYETGEKIKYYYKSSSSVVQVYEVNKSNNRIIRARVDGVTNFRFYDPIWEQSKEDDNIQLWVSIQNSVYDETVDQLNQVKKIYQAEQNTLLFVRLKNFWSGLWRHSIILPSKGPKPQN